MGGFVGKLTDAVGLTDIEGQQDAAKDAAKAQAQSGQQSIAFQRESRDLARSDLQPFRQLGQSNIEALQNLLTPTGQYDYLQNNPLFKAALDNANRATLNNQAARGKLGSGDTLSALSNNTLLAAQPLLGQQQNALFNAVNLGQSSAAGQANTALTSGANIGNTLTDIGNAKAAGIIGAGNAYSQQMQGLINAGAQLGGAAMMSDIRMKRNIRRIGSHGDYPVYRYQYVFSDDWYEGVMAQDVEKINPGAVVTVNGIKYVKYAEL